MGGISGAELEGRSSVDAMKAEHSLLPFLVEDAMKIWGGEEPVLCMKGRKVSDLPQVSMGYILLFISRVL